MVKVYFMFGRERGPKREVSRLPFKKTSDTVTLNTSRARPISQDGEGKLIHHLPRTLSNNPSTIHAHNNQSKTCVNIKHVRSQQRGCNNMGSTIDHQSTSIACLRIHHPPPKAFNRKRTCVSQQRGFHHQPSTTTTMPYISINN
jgi:hypothetical protein